MNRIECPGLDGSNPLHFMASLGVLRIGSAKDFIRKMSWDRKGHWFPSYETTAPMDPDAFCGELSIAFVDQELSCQRTLLEQIEKQCEAVEQRIVDLRAACKRGSQQEHKSAKASMAEALAERKRRNRERKRLEARLYPKPPKAGGETSAVQKDVQTRFPVVTMADHLDDTEKGGLSREQLRQAFLREAVPPILDLSGLAGDLHLFDKKKAMIARTHFSFANNNSGKCLLKDFASSACYVTPGRIRNALIENGNMLDAITGLGWDPASQRSYALQFNDPSNEVFSQTALNALAFIGLSFFTVCPDAGGRATVCFARLHADEEMDDRMTADASREHGGTIECFTWPIWDGWLSESTVRAALNVAELHARNPNTELLFRMGIIGGFRSRRFSANKRSFFAPSRSL